MGIKNINTILYIDVRGGVLDKMQTILFSYVVI